MRRHRHPDAPFFAAVLELRAAENDLARWRGKAPDLLLSRVERARARVLSQRAHSLRGVLWRLRRLAADLAVTEATLPDLAMVRAAVRDLCAIGHTVRHPDK